MIRLSELKAEFSKLNLLSKHERMLELCGLLTSYLSESKITPIIVGGLSVEIYTRNHYTTQDIDLISDGRAQIDSLLTEELGFKREGRVWYHEKLELSLEIPGNFLEGNLEKVIQMELDSGREVSVIGIEDLIIHRLESAIVSQSAHPEWTEDYEWAERMFFIHKEDDQIMDIEYLMRKAKETKTDQLINEWLKK